MPSLAARVSAWLEVPAWVVLALAATGVALVPARAGQTASPVLMVGIAAVATVVVARLGVAAVAWPQRRLALLLLAGALISWLAGAAVLTGVGRAGSPTFPGPGEGFFLVAYALMAGFLLLDAAGGRRVGAAVAVETVITVGGAVSLAGVLLLTPVADDLRRPGADVLVTLLYPVLDLTLTAWVLADLLLGRRVWSQRAGLLLAGLGLFAVSDSIYSWQLVDGVVDVGVVTATGWGAALTCLAAGACGPPPQRPERDRAPTVLPQFVAAGAAVLVLALAPSQVRTVFLIGPCVVTLVAAGGRLSLALREARGAAAAYRLSLTDDLTELPNRRALIERLQAGPDAVPEITLLLLDLDGFKEVNDTLGHVAGDQVLQHLAHRLSTLDEAILVARLGGDEFAVLMPGGEEEPATRAAARIRELVADPLEVQEHSLTMGTSVGVAISRHPDSHSDLLRRADIAMYQAKKLRAGSLVYDPDRDEFTTDRLKTVAYLRLGIPAGQLRAWYQPQVRATSRRVTGLEALVRWEHPELGVLSPAAFLPIARQSGLMPLLTETVVHLVLRDIRRWQEGGARLKVSFNVSPPELLNTQLLERLLEQIDAARLIPWSLVLEVTEDLLLADPERARQALTEIRRHQVEVSIDDYGTGFSSLSYLRDLPVHELKLDRSFISTVRTDARSRIIVSSTNQMAQGLGLRTVAEGVEDAQMAETARELGIDLLQGYFIARPMPAEDVLGWISAWQDQLAGAHGYRP